MSNAQVAEEAYAELYALYEQVCTDLVTARAEVEELTKHLPTPECRIDEFFSGGCPCDCHVDARAALVPRKPHA